MHVSQVTEGHDAVEALKTLREGKTPGEFDEGMGEMIVSALFSREHKATHVADVIFQTESPVGKQTFQCRFVEKPGQEMRQEEFQKWFESHRDLLAGNEISVAITDFKRWQLPSPEELHRLGRISGYRIPEVFGPTEGEQAVATFGKGDIHGCMKTFLRMLADRESPQTRNNLAFCQILTGDVAAGLENAKKAVEGDYEPLFEMNKGIAEFLLGEVNAAKLSLKNALQQLRAPGSKLDAEANYVLVIDPSDKKVDAKAELPVDAAIMINLWRMADSTREELETALVKFYPEKAQSWLALFTAP
jgi:hypothetical protein